ncbi:OmpH family outer membrane protein [Fuchsiella alkaliacetigena]|uniref:OmpH family outer membrane protein n=1 Tax=Fuchsiella alkaliacetigena TaxID=957042 RepID=UPI00200A2C3D|nr:OmpH family outer membrane protein [Fuchsiella alkaliacetigena]MCK8825591.1 OmpH family outer membrane protein [Fuchsiella alkaliacetigena]
MLKNESTFKSRLVMVLLLISVFVAGSSLVGVAAAQDLDIVYVDTQQVFEAHPAAQEATQQLQTRQQEMQEDLGAMEDEEGMMQQQQMQEELQQLQNDLLEEAMAEVQADVQEIAEEKGYDYIVDEQMLLAGGEDVTDEILDELDGASPQQEELEQEQLDGLGN